MLIMKLAYILLGLLTLAISPVQAQCKDCGCKDKCSPSCKCPNHSPVTAALDSIDHAVSNIAAAAARIDEARLDDSEDLG
jgi:hypothetical protein